LRRIENLEKENLEMQTSFNNLETFKSEVAHFKLCLVVLAFIKHKKNLPFPRDFAILINSF